MAADSPRSSRGRPAAAACWQIACCNRQRRLPVRQADLRRLLTAALTELGAEAADLSVAIVNDAEMAELHERWLGVPGPTDVLSFDLASPPEPTVAGGHHRLRITGEIIASGETAVREADRYHWRPDDELAYYLIHGLLHLCGFDDRDPRSRQAMRRRERRLMTAIGLPPPPRRIRPESPQHRAAVPSTLLAR